MGKVIAVCTSDRRGIQKHDVNSGYFEVNWGIDGDAHAGSWHRQVSLLSADKIAAFNEKGAGVIPGPLAKIWWWTALISVRCRWGRCCAAARCCWK